MKIADIEPISLFVPIDDLEINPVSLPHAEELTSHVFRGYRTTLVRVQTDTGISGVGECMVRFAPEATAAVVNELKPALIGKDPRDTDVLWDLMFSSMMNRGHYKGFFIEAISGIDIALWDIAGKAAGVPVAALLGGQHRKEVRAYASSVRLRKTREETLEAVHRFLDSGYTAMKVKVGRDVWGWRDEMRLVEAIRELVGDDVALMADANCAYDRATALSVGRALESLDLRWFEEPISPDDVQGYALLSRALDIAVAAGETEFTRWGFRDLLEARAVDIIQPNVSRTGGLSECRKISALASAYHIPYAPHTGSSSAICMAASLQLASSLEGFLIYEHMQSDWSKTQPNPLRTELIVEPVEIFRDGAMVVPDRPGIGAELNEEIIERFRL